jgi:predicted acylesterase/phospholipase RssA
MQKTVFFKNCLGVFQGGGCRAAAFAGAYEEAVRRGVSFSEVAGASAGSVVAALIGAGASPSFISERLSALKFTELLAPPGRNILRSIIPKVGFAKQALDIYLDHGLYSTKALKIWVDQLLSALLPAVLGSVTFKSLPLPTFIVSTDLAAMSAKVWSQQTTPNEQVSEAVVASCSIPIFFQPTNGRYVDGGLLSNLPSYVFASGIERRPLASKILAFSLQSEAVNTEISGLWDYTSRLLSTLIDGGKRLQLELQSNVHVVDIPTGSVRATDFARMTPEITQTLITNGAKATADFLERERINIHSSSSRSNICFDQDVTHCRITEFASQRLSRVIISESNSDWVYRLFPTILSLLEQGTTVDVLLPEFGDNEKHGPYRRRLGAIEKLRITGSKSVRIMCDLLHAGCNPHEIEKFLKPPFVTSVQIKHLPRLHSKVYLSEQAVIVGSANASSNGLGDYDVAENVEAAILTDDTPILLEVRSWFQQQWVHAEPVTDKLIKASNRIPRPPRPKSTSLVNFYEIQLGLEGKLRWSTSTIPLVLKRNALFGKLPKITTRRRRVKAGGMAKSHSIKVMHHWKKSKKT